MPVLKKKITPKVWNELKDVYLNNPGMSINQLGELARTKYGLDVVNRTIAAHAQEDGWEVERNILYQDSGKSTNLADLDVGEMVSEVLNILYQSILKDWQESGMVEPQKVNSFMALLEKSKVDIVASQVSARTSLQEVLASIDI